MPEGDRHIVIGFALVVFVLIIGALWHVSSYSQEQRQQREEAASYKAYSDEDLAQCASKDTDFDRFACLAEKITANQEQERGRANLHAQQDMSAWAVALLWVSGIGIIVSIAGIVLIYATLHETRAMTVATREIGQRQVRAYLTVQSGHFAVDDQGDIWIFINFKNVGQTPGIITEVRGSCEPGISRHFPEVDGSTGIPTDANKPMVQIAAGETYEMVLVWKKADVVEYRDPDHPEILPHEAIGMDGRVKWLDVFNDEDFTNFRMSNFEPLKYFRERAANRLSGRLIVLRQDKGPREQ